MSLDEEAKTALVCLIPRLIDPKVGRVRVDGVDLRDVTLESVRAQVATVLQADLVFSDTVLANIALGDPSYDLPRVIEAAKVAHAHHFIQESAPRLRHDHRPPRSLSQARPAIPDRPGPGLSSTTPRSSSSRSPTPLDDDTKAYVDDTVARLAPGRTLIMLPHRLSTIRTSDRVILIHNGRLEAFGTPREIKAAASSSATSSTSSSTSSPLARSRPDRVIEG